MVGLRLDDFDGGFIIAPWDRFKELIEWYSTHLDLKVTYEEDYPVEKWPLLLSRHWDAYISSRWSMATRILQSIGDKTEMFASASPQRILKLHTPIFANRIFK